MRDALEAALVAGHMPGFDTGDSSGYSSGSDLFFGIGSDTSEVARAINLADSSTASVSVSSLFEEMSLDEQQ